jgi:hypothetical protein
MEAILLSFVEVCTCIVAFVLVASAMLSGRSL